ncbi:MAG: fumarate hydratase C-terminal domain-containing protein [Parvularculaceae bacterium]|nr:fumarate hydratase C-terminal domain-containing protein [Parvularculaceae bacterium]
MAVQHLTTPVSRETVRTLRAGDSVFLSGDIIVTGGAPGHKRLNECLDKGIAPPIEMNGTFIHLPHLVEKTDSGFDIRYVNPTTSARFDEYIGRFVREFDLVIVGGKGGLSTATAAVMKEVGCVYLSLLGGGSPILTQSIVDVKETAWTDLPAHFRLSKLTVREMGPLIVGIDASGRSLYDELPNDARSRRDEILASILPEDEGGEAGVQTT